MRRDLRKLADAAYDLLIIGGGIYGACTAWEAVSRGLTVALVEKNDFGAATSANSLKVIHGGLRYLQHADIKRMRESIRERRNLLRIAPHLVHPLPILVPTYGHGVKGREAMSVALAINDLVSCDRNWSIPDQAQHIPSGKVVSKAECIARLPGITPDGLTGGATFCDAQVYNSERLTLAFLQSASSAGADVVNYARVTSFVRDGTRIAGAAIVDEQTGHELTVYAKLVINTAGPWIHQIQNLAARSSSAPSEEVLQAKAVNLVVPKFIDKDAVGLSSRRQYRDSDAVIDKGSRFLFTVPWRDKSMVGTWYFPYRQTPDTVAVTDAELQLCLDDINSAYPPANLSLKDIAFVHCGLLPSSGLSPHTADVQLAKHYRIQSSHPPELEGLLSVAGVKYTTARDVAEKVINQAAKLLGKSLAPSTTAKTPVRGGAISDLEAFCRQVASETPLALTRETIQRLVYTYGTDCLAIAKAAGHQNYREPIEKLLAAEVQHAVREEMALHLTDVLLRRTDIGSAGKPSDEVLQFCADVMAEQLGWNPAQRQAELQHIHDFYAARVPQHRVPERAMTEV